MRNEINKHLYEKLKESRPSMLRMSVFSWVLTIAGGLVALGCIVLGAAIYIDVKVGKKLLALIKDNPQSIEAQVGDKKLSLFLATVFIIGGLLFYGISFLSRRLILRNNYIMELEELMDDEIKKNISESIKLQHKDTY